MTKSKSDSTSAEMYDKGLRRALAAIVTYDLIENPQVSRRQMAIAVKHETGLDLSAADFNNFMRTASAQGFTALFEYYKKRVTNEGYYRSCPSFIRHAISECFNYRPRRSAMSGTLMSIYKHIADVSPLQVDGVSRTYAGVWNVFRYSGHQGPDVKEDDDPYITRSAMEIIARDPDDETSLPQFVIHYRPQGLVVPDHYYTVDGVIVPLKNSKHMTLFGYEKDSGSPLDILATKEVRQPSDPRLEEFTGLVKRQHEFGHFMVARVHCIREGKKSLGDLTPHIGMFKQSELTTRLKDEYPNFHVNALYERIGNRIANKGRASLRL